MQHDHDATAVNETMPNFKQDDYTIKTKRVITLRFAGRERLSLRDFSAGLDPRARPLNGNPAGRLSAIPALKYHYLFRTHTPLSLPSVGLSPHQPPPPNGGSYGVFIPNTEPRTPNFLTS